MNGERNFNHGLRAGVANHGWDRMGKAAARIIAFLFMCGVLVGILWVMAILCGGAELLPPLPSPNVMRVPPATAVLYLGTNSGFYVSRTELGWTNSCTATNLKAPNVCYAAVTWKDRSGLESTNFSAEASFTNVTKTLSWDWPSQAITNRLVFTAISEVSTDLVRWTAVATQMVFSLTNASAVEVFWRFKAGVTNR